MAFSHLHHGNHVVVDYHVLPLGIAAVPSALGLVFTPDWLSRCRSSCEKSAWALKGSRDLVERVSSDQQSFEWPGGYIEL